MDENKQKQMHGIKEELKTLLIHWLDIDCVGCTDCLNCPLNNLTSDLTICDTLNELITIFDVKEDKNENK